MEEITEAAKELLAKIDDKVAPPDGLGPDFGSPAETAEWLKSATERLRKALASND